MRIALRTVFASILFLGAASAAMGGCGGDGNGAGGSGGKGSGGSAPITDVDKCREILDALCTVYVTCPMGPDLETCRSIFDCATVTSVADDWETCKADLADTTCASLEASMLPPACVGVFTFQGPPDPLGGAWDVSFGEGTGSSCDVPAHTASVGSITESAIGLVVDDGDGDASVSCDVTGNTGGPFVVRGTVASGGASLTVEVPTISRDASQGNPVTGMLSYGGPQTNGDQFESSSCTFWFVGGEAIVPGKVWLSFACPAVKSGSQTCAIEKGVLELQGCDH